MRIAIDARMATWGGVGTYTRELLRALARDHSALGIEHILALRSPVDDFLEDVDFGDVVEWRLVPGSPWSPVSNARLGLAARDRADVFHAPHFPVPIGFDGPLVTTIHDLIPLLEPEAAANARIRVAFAGLVRWAVTQSDVVVCVTRSAADTVIQRFGGDTHFLVIHHGLGLATPTVPEAPEAPAPPAATAATAADRVLAGYGLNSGYVLWVGALKPHKDVPTLLAAHRLLPAEVRARHPLVLAGDDATPEGRALRFDLSGSFDEREGRVRLLGAVPSEDLPALYDGAAAFAFPSRIEGFGLPPLEAMAHGVPVVASRADPMPEVLGDAALYFTPGDHRDLAARLQDVLADPALAQRLRERGGRRVRRYSWERTARETAAAYRLAIASRH